MNKDYSVFFANRSAAFDHVGRFAACVHDIDESLKFGYPRELWYKIYKRKGHACIKMKQYLVAKEALETALKNVGRSDIKKEKDRDTYRTRVKKQMTVFNVTKQLYNCEFVERMESSLAGGALEDRGLSKKIKIQEDGPKKALVASGAVEVQDNLVSLDPYVHVVNVTGGRAGGKICPHTLEKMFHPVPCSFGSLQTFSTFEARDEASRGYHRFEWSILAALQRVGLQERAQLALRMVTQLEPTLVTSVLDSIKKPDSEPPINLEVAIKTFRLPVSSATDEEKLASTTLGLFLLHCLEVSGYTKASSSGMGKEQLAVFSLLQRALLVALHHTR